MSESEDKRWSKYHIRKKLYLHFERCQMVLMRMLARGEKKIGSVFTDTELEQQMQDDTSLGCSNNPFSGFWHTQCVQNTHVHPSLKQLCMKCCHDKIKNAFPQSYVHSTMTCTQPHPSPQQHRLWTRTTDGHSQSPQKSASRENYTTQSAHYLSSFAASYLLDVPSPAGQRIWIPWGRFPSYVPCAAVQQAIDLITCFKTKLLLENGNKLILQLDLNILWTPERFSVFMTCSIAEAYAEIWIHFVYSQSHYQKKCLSISF